MASGRAADREDPGNSRRNAARSLDRDPISELHQGQRSDAPHRRAGHMTAPDQIARTASKALARGGRPHMTYAPSAVGGFPTVCFPMTALNSDIHLKAVLAERGRNMVHLNSIER